MESCQLYWSFQTELSVIRFNGGVKHQTTTDESLLRQPLTIWNRHNITTSQYHNITISKHHNITSLKNYIIKSWVF